MAGNAWIFAGLASSFPNIEPDSPYDASELHTASAKPHPSSSTSPGSLDIPTSEQIPTLLDADTQPDITCEEQLLQEEAAARDAAELLASLPVSTCKIIQCGASTATEVTTEEAQRHLGGDHPQALVFRYRGKFVAMDHSCPHQTFPLSRGSVADIEDFGVVLSAGITCPGHGWTFDLFTGYGDRGNYRLALWDVEVRPGAGDGDEEEVWVRRKEDPMKNKRRIG